MKYKLHNFVAYALVVSSLFPLSGCETDNKVTFKNENELSYLVNPFDWNPVPEVVSFEVEGNSFSMDIDSFYRLVNKPEDIIYLKTDDGEVSVSRLYLKEKADEEFSNYQNRVFDDFLKGAITLGEIAGVVYLGKQIVKKALFTALF